MSHRGLETAPFPILLCWLPKQFESPFPSWRALKLTRLAPQHLSRIFCGQIHRCTPITTTSAKYRHERWFRFNKNPNSKNLVRNTNYTSQTILWEYNWICMYIIYICVCVFHIQPHKAVAEVSKIGEVSCCDAWMAERFHWWTGKWLESCFLECLQCLQWSPHPQLLAVVCCSVAVVLVVA